MNHVIVPMTSREQMDAKAYVHWKSWQQTYEGLIDPDYLARRTLQSCREMARRWPDNLLLAQTGDGQTVGFVGYGKNADPDLQNCGEIHAIYVLKEYQKQGIGYALMNAGLAKLRGFSRVAVWVLKENCPAIRFYERYGFQKDGAEKEILLGKPMTEIRLVFD